MAKEPNQAKWVGIRPTDPEEPFTVIQGTAANLKVEAAIAAGQSITVVQANPASLVATIIGNDAYPLKVKQNVAANLKVEAAIAANQSIAVTQATPANLKTEVVPASTAIWGVYFKRPAGSTQFWAHGSIENGEVTIHTVAEGKTLYICNCSICCFNENTIARYGLLSIKNAIGGTQTRLIYLRVPSGENMLVAMPMFCPYEVEEFFTVNAQSQTTGVKIRYTMQGYIL